MEWNGIRGDAGSLSLTVTPNGIEIEAKSNFHKILFLLSKAQSESKIDFVGRYSSGFGLNSTKESAMA